MAMKPTIIQREALDALRRTRSGRHKAGLVVMATGLGKTVLSALFAEKFKRVLFIAHRREILEQAAATFVRADESRTASFFAGSDKDLSGDVVSASVQTLARNLKKLKRDEFDLVVVDEFHHAPAVTYRRVIDYFQPKFLLGLTATPERTDRQNVWELCGENEIYRCELDEAIRRKALVPIEYHGVRDTIDFEPIPWRNNDFDPEMVARAAATKRRSQRAFEEWEMLKGERTLAFCCTIPHAEHSQKFWKKKGVKTALVTGNTPDAERRKALRDLADGEIEIIFSVDVFGEGVDVPKVDTILQLRPTLSKIVWMQQVGRGLRKAKGKTHVKVIDFIGNHRRFYYHIENVRRALGGSDAGKRSVLEELEDLERDWEQKKGERRRRKWSKRKDDVREKRIELPNGCSVDVDLELVRDLTSDGVRERMERGVEMVRGGMTATAVAKKLKVDVSTVCGWCRKAGQNIGYHKDFEIKDRAVRLVRDGMSARAAAKEVGVNATSVWKWCKQAGVPLNDPRSHSQQIKDRAVRLVRDGMSAKAAAKEVGASDRAVGNWCKQAGVPLNDPKSYSQQIRDRAVRLVQDGMSARQVAESLEICQTTISKWCRKAGVSTKRAKK